MRGFSLRPNLVFNWDSAAFRIDRLPPGDSVLIERVEDGEYKIVKKDELLQEFSAGRISVEQVADSVTKSRTYSRPMTDIPESLRNEVRRRLTYLRALEAHGGPLFTPAFTRPISLQIAEQMGDKTPPSATTLYRWHCLYRQANDSASLLPRTDRRGSRMLRQGERVLQLAEEAIEEAFLTSPKAGANAVHTVCRRHRGLSTTALAQHPRLTLRQAADSLGIGEKTLKHLVDASVIEATEAKTTKGRAIATIHRAQLDLIADLPVSAMSLKDAAAALAIPKHRLRELIDAGVTKPLLHRREANASQWLISTSEVENLNQLPGTNRGEGVPLKQVLKNWRLRPGEFPDLVRAILDGSIELLQTEEQSVFGDRMCSKTSVTSWREAAVGANSPLSVDQAARALGIKQQVAYALVHSGLIQTDRRQKPIQIGREALESFQRKYVSLAELAGTRRTSSRRMLLELEAVPVCGPSVDGCRQYFFRRLEVLV